MIQDAYANLPHQYIIIGLLLTSVCNHTETLKSKNYRTHMQAQVVLFEIT